VPLFSNKLFRGTPVVHFNEIKLVKEDDIEDKERQSKNIGAMCGRRGTPEGGGMRLKRYNPDKRLLANLDYNTMHKATFHSTARKRN